MDGVLKGDLQAFFTRKSRVADRCSNLVLRQFSQSQPALAVGVDAGGNGQFGTSHGGVSSRALWRSGKNLRLFLYVMEMAACTGAMPQAVQAMAAVIRMRASLWKDCVYEKQ
jgi:hypothetical protein